MTQDFRAAMIEHGLNPPDYIAPGEIYRFPGADKSNDSTAGWCKLFDDQQAGVFGDWSTGLSELWIAKRETHYSPEERAAFMQHVAEARMKAEDDSSQEYARAAGKAKMIWSNCKEIDDPEYFDYLKRKKIKAHGVRIGQGGFLTVPVYIEDALSSLQLISPDGSKKFLTGGRAKGGYYVIGDFDTHKPICIAEGFATAATIFETTSYATIVAFSAGNLKPVSLAWRDRFPDATFILCADDDALSKGNPGVAAAHEAAVAIKAKIAIPTFGTDRPDGATDFNDMAAVLGSDAVAKCINAVLDKPKQHTDIAHGVLTHEQVAELFKDCIHINKEDSILFKESIMTEEGAVDRVRLLTVKQFDNAFGGRRFPLDPEYKKYTQYASEAFLHSTVYAPFRRQADRTWSNPQQAFGEASLSGNDKLVNRFIPAHVKRKKGDITPFLTHVNKLFPDKRDQKIILSYMAACVQYQGIKFNWCPIIQGVKGNGKGTLRKFLTYCLGQQYCTSISPQQLEPEYNSFLLEKLLIVMEDIYVDHDKIALYEKLKVLITNPVHSIRKMRMDHFDAQIFCNLWLESNHLDCLRMEDDERRYAFFITPQQTKEDKLRDGITAEYTKDLYHWMDHRDGLAFVAEYLFTYPIEYEFNPSPEGGASEAPETSTRHLAIKHSYSLVEQEVLDVIDEGCTYGAKGNFISSVAINIVLERLRRTYLKGSKRTTMMNTIGYVLHPALPGGRLTQETIQEKRPYIYVKKDSLEYRINCGKEVTDLYLRAQQQ